jgi:hypothetical protein
MMLEARSFRGLHCNYQKFEVSKLLPKMEYQNFLLKVILKTTLPKSSLPKMNQKCRELT